MLLRSLGGIHALLRPVGMLRVLLHAVVELRVLHRSVEGLRVLPSDDTFSTRKSQSSQRSARELRVLVFAIGELPFDATRSTVQLSSEEDPLCQ